MQQLQTTVLKTLQPGIVPIFIISPNKSDGDSLALLLSNHIEFTNIFFDSENRKFQKNFFVSEDTQNIIPDTADFLIDKITEYQASIKFAIEKGFDSKKLWGIQLDYGSFFELEISKLFPDSFFIFLYGTKIKKKVTVKIENRDINKDIKKLESSKKPALRDENYVHKVQEFYNSHSDSAALLHVNDILFIPEVAIKALSLDSNIAVLKNISDIKSYSLSDSGSDIMHFENEATSDLIDDFHTKNLIAKRHNWFDGSDILVIMILGEYGNNEIILKKVQQFSNSFLSSPLFNIICKNELEKHFVQQLIENNRQYSAYISITACHTNISTTLNEIINNSGRGYIIIDNLTVSYKVTNVMLPYKSLNPPAFIFANSFTDIEDRVTDRVNIVDILTVNTIPDNISFSKSTWKLINGFDTSLDNKIAIWDFTVRILQNPQNYALETEAAMLIKEIEYEDLEKQMIPYEGYKTIVDKHKTLFENSLNEIIKIFSENQYLPHHKIIKLNSRLNSLNSVLSHAQHELHSLNVIRGQMQHHINLIESRWYYKLARKIGHYKSIFFKRESSGKSGILKFIKFLFFALTKPGFRIVRKIIKGAIRKLYLLIEDRPVKIVYLDNSGNENVLNYNDWIREKLDKNTLKKEFNTIFPTLKNKPKISVILPVYNTPIHFLNDAIMSVLDQFYENWQLCIADDCSTNPQIKRMLNSYSMKDKRINVVFREENGHISEASNSALALATGDYVMLLDHDDVLTPNAMFEVVRHLNEFPENELVYSDEDKLDERGNYMDPFFKPNWSPDRFMAINYVSHLVTIKKALVDKIGGFRKGLEGSQDYDLLLRIFELTNKIGHIPKVLYHWRIHAASVASEETNAKPYAYIAAKKALEESLVRSNTPGEVHYLPLRGSYRIKYAVQSYDKVSIIIPTKDQVQLMRNTVDSIFSLTSYPNYEVIVLNNNSTTKEFFDLMAEYEELYPDRFRCIEASFPFNFSKLINLGVSLSKGEYILMLNNDVEIIQNDWVTNMVSFCQHKRIGAVGVKLLYPNDHIQHAGTVIGLGSVAGHVLVGLHKDSPGYFNCLQTATNYSAVTAACLMCRKDVYEEIGGMEEKLEVEYNDVDFCLKMVEHGYYNVYVPDVTLYHYESTTRGHPSQNKASHERHLREVGYFKEKWVKYIMNDPYYNPNLTLSTQDFRVELTK